MTDIYEQAAAFHHKFDNQQPEIPQPLDCQTATYRAEFVLEELVEYVATTCSDDQSLNQVIAQLHTALNKAQVKMQTKSRAKQDTLVKQLDALGDIIYLTYGTAVLTGVNPAPVITAIHDANMGKLFPDGQPHRDAITNKVLKPSDWEANYAPEPKIKAAILAQNPAAKLNF